ncbi:MAG TPA: ChaN family lipoprotein [Thermodesulfovibrionales bacterium]|nr:ChaN family lipoprotein [Thermodesulfovibrionales bacterium]
MPSEAIREEVVSTEQSGVTHQDKPAYQLFTPSGKAILYREMVRDLSAADVVLFGEFHNNPIVHWLQYEVTKDLFELKGECLILGAEMFEADDQIVLDEYLEGKINRNHLMTEAKVWNNYATDYEPLVKFALGRNLRFIATNIPRRYASLVAREGLEALEGLGEEAKRFIAPLPVVIDMSSPGYTEMAEVGMAHGMGTGPENFMAAQAMKDATMAHFILKHRAPKSLFLHFNGEYHSRNYGGICWYLRKADPGLIVRIISPVEGAPLTFQEDYRGLGDVVLVVPPEMTRTYEED